MWGLFGRVGSLLKSLPSAGALPNVLRGAPTSLGGKIMQGLGGIENASLGLGGLMYGADVLRKQTDALGLTYSPQELSQMYATRQRPIGSPSVLNQKPVYWAGENYGYQSPESFNKLFRTKLPAGVVLPPPEPAYAPGFDSGSWQQAGQLTPPSPPVTPTVSPGIVSTGAGVPAQRQNVQERALSQEVLNAAQQYAAPASVPLSSFYAGQQQLGRSALKTGDLLNQLQQLGGAQGMTPETLKQWAEQNPGLAYREMLRLKGRS